MRRFAQERSQLPLQCLILEPNSSLLQTTYLQVRKMNTVQRKVTAENVWANKGAPHIREGLAELSKWLTLDFTALHKTNRVPSHKAQSPGFGQVTGWLEKHNYLMHNSFLTTISVSKSPFQFSFCFGKHMLQCLCLKFKSKPAAKCLPPVIQQQQTSMYSCNVGASQHTETAGQISTGVIRMNERKTRENTECTNQG